jgi:hypothetical protein
MSILDRVQRLVRAEWSAASASLDAALAPPAPMAPPLGSADARRMRCQQLDAVSQLEAQAVAAAQAGDSRAARAWLAQARQIEDTILQVRPNSDSGAWSAAPAASAGTRALPPNPYGVQSAPVRRIPSSSWAAVPSSAPVSASVGPYGVRDTAPVAGFAPMTPTEVPATDAFARAGATMDAFDAMAGRLAGQSDALSAMAEVDALLRPAMPEDLVIPGAAPTPEDDALRRLQQNLEPQS